MSLRIVLVSLAVALTTGAVLVAGDLLLNDDSMVCPSTLTGEAGPCFLEGGSVSALLVVAVMVATFVASVVALAWTRDRHSKK